MGLASKLQMAQAAMNTLGPMAGSGHAGAMHAGAPSAPPYPPAAGTYMPHGSAPTAAAPYPAAQPYAGTNAAPYATPAGYPHSTAGPYTTAPGTTAAPYPSTAPGGTGTSPYPSPYPPGSIPAQTIPSQTQQQQQHMASSAPYPSAQQATPGQYPQQQQQPYGAPPPAVPGGGMAGSIAAKLSSCVAANGLNRFYPPQALSSLASRLESRVNFRELAARWSMPVELALDLAQLALYDIVLLADDSGSMAFEENGERIEDLKMIAQKVSEVATLFDDDGILVRFMNSNVQGNGIRSASDLGSLLAGVSYSGLTPLATSLRDKVLGPIVFSLAGSGQLAKPVLVITITDGEPTDNPKDLVVQVIKDAQARLAAQYGPKAIAFEFCQVGKDQRAQAFLAELDSHPQVGGSIDCTSYYELECVEYQRRGINLSPSMWLVKMMVGAVDMSHDKGDER